VFDHPQGRFTSRHSGVRFRFFSDVDDPRWTLDARAFDDAFHLALLVDPGHANPEIAHVMACLRQRIVVDDEFAGDVVNVFLPGEPDACLADGRVIHPAAPRSTRCQQSGFTPPTIEVEFLLWHPVQERIMVLTTGRYEPAERPERVTRLVVHEAMHAMLTLTDTPLRLHPDERWVEYHERRLSADAARLRPVLSYEPASR
jgi:hypothetical protein